MINLGTDAPPFTLPVANPDVDEKGGDTRSLSDYADAEAVVVIFMCNHCPYVVTMEDRLLETARAYQEKGVQFIGISANDADAYPEDSFEAMAERAKAKAYPFPYLYDESQAIAHAYDAACTPDLYVYDAAHKLRYRGRFDDGRPGMDQPTTHDLQDALDELLNTGTVTTEQYPSMGCNIKWKAI